MRDSSDNPLNRLLDNPVSYAVLAALVILGVAQGWLDGWYAVVLLGVGAFGAYRWFKNRNSKT